MNSKTRALLKCMIGAGYLVSIHLLLVLMLYTSDFLPRVMVKVGLGRYYAKANPCYERTLKSQLSMDLSVPDQSVLFYGDSITQNLCILNITHDGVNFGMSDETTAGVLKRLGRYSSLKKARAVVIAAGINDVASLSDDRILQNYSEILVQVPPHIPVIVGAILPIDEGIKPEISNKRIAALNRRLHQICSGRERCCFVDSGEHLASKNGSLQRDYHIGDGVHLNKEGYHVWAQELKAALSAFTGRQE